MTAYIASPELKEKLTRMQLSGKNSRAKLVRQLLPQIESLRARGISLKNAFIAIESILETGYSIDGLINKYYEVCSNDAKN